MNITYVTNFPSIDVKYWSGTIYYMAKNLEKKANVDYIADLQAPDSLSLKLKRKIYGRHKQYWTDRSPEITKGYAQQIMSRLSPTTDIILSPSSSIISRLHSSKPTVFYADATFASILNYYDYLSNFSDKYISEGMKTESLALKNSSLAIYASDWAAESAIKDYNADPAKVKVVPLGANTNKRLSLSEVQELIDKRDKKTCRILFLGVEWKRKGADIVIDAVRLLNEMGLSTEVHMVGIPELPLDEVPPYVINHGFIGKNKPEGLRKLEDLIGGSHFLFVPSRAEAYGVVFCEAMSFGVPCVSTRTGGIPTIIKNELNGIILDIEAEAKEYAEHIYKAYTDKAYYKELALSAFNDFETRLNWDVAMDKVVSYMREL